MDTVSSQRQLCAFIILLMATSCGLSAFQIENVTVISNLTYFDWPTVYHEYCGRMCVGGELIVREDRCGDRCFPCECGDDCIQKGTCCPSQDMFENEKNVNVPPNTIYHLYRQSMCIPMGLGYNEFHFAIGICPLAWEDIFVRRKCEQSDGNTLEEMIPYTEPETGLTFRNVFCVICNGFGSLVNSIDLYELDLNTLRTDPPFKINSLQSWLVGVYCIMSYNWFNIYHYTDLKAFANDALQDKFSHFCQVRPVKRSAKAKECFDSISYSSCPNHDDHGIYKELCSDLPYMLPLQVQGAKNVFCYYCSTRDYMPDQCDSFWASRSMLFESREQTFDPYAVTADNVESRDRCWGLGEKKEDGSCVSVVCTPGKLLGEGGDRCVTAIVGIKYLRYTLHTVFNAIVSIPPNVTVSDDVYEIVNKTFDDIDMHRRDIHDARAYPFQYRYVTKMAECLSTTDIGDIDDEEDDDNANDNGDGRKLHVSGFNESKKYLYEVHVWMQNVQNNSYILRDDYETYLLNFFTRTQFSVHIGNAVETPLSLVCLGIDFCDLYQYNSIFKTCTGSSELGGEERLEEIKNYDIRWDDEDLEFVDITPSLDCPFVSIKVDSEPIVLDASVVFPVYINERVVNISDARNVSFQNGELQICVSHLDQIMRQAEENKIASHPSVNILLNVNLPLYSIVNAISCLLLSLSVISFLVFPSLRSVTGLNTGCLSLCLLTAQVCLIVTFIFGTQPSLGGLHCMIHGAFLHYSWLASFVWTNTYSIQTYRTCTCKESLSVNRQFLYYCVFSFGCPLLIVVISIIAKMTLTPGSIIANDDDHCFLNTDKYNVITILGLIVPLGFSVLVNCGLLPIIIRTPRLSTTTKPDHPNMKGIGVYTVAFSTFSTTLCYISMALAVFVFEFHEMEILFIFSLFAALESAYIFISMFWNKQLITSLSSISKKL